MNEKQKEDVSKCRGGNGKKTEEEGKAEDVFLCYLPS